MDDRHFSYITKSKKKHPALKFIFPHVASGDRTQEAYIDIGRVKVFEASTLTTFIAKSGRIPNYIPSNKSLKLGTLKSNFVCECVYDHANNPYICYSVNVTIA
jgi:hypothetical protein